MQEAQALAPLLEPLVPFFDWVAAHPAEALLLIASLPLVLTAAVVVFGRRPPPPPGAEEPALPPAGRAALEAPATEILPRAEAAPGVAVPEAPAPPTAAPAAPAELAPLAAAPAEAMPPVVAPPRPVPAPPPPAAPAPPPAASPVEAVAPSRPVEAPRPARLADRLSRTRMALVGGLGRLFAGGRRLEGDVLEELEALLFGADLGVKTTESLLDAIRGKAAGGGAGDLRRVLRETILEKLRRVEPEGSPLAVAATPHVVLVLGVNGSGKTTTIGKLAARHSAQGRRVVLGAGDTFRAAAIEQLEIWGERVGCEVVKGVAGGDPAAVAFDSVKAAKARNADVAIIDTAGRLQTKAPLVEELRKIVRVIGRECPGAPHETLLVLDANTGQNAISQARVFTEAAGVSGLVLTKLDGTAKGGVLVGLADEFGLPVRWVGVGEGIEDLREFRAEEFVEALFTDEGAA
jgi:fused signal recognition particle receptor